MPQTLSIEEFEKRYGKQGETLSAAEWEKRYAEPVTPKRPGEMSDEEEADLRMQYGLPQRGEGVEDTKNLAKFAGTTAAMTALSGGLGAVAGMPGVVGTVARVAGDPRVTAPIAFGYELMRSGDPARAAYHAAGAGGASVGLGRAAKYFGKKALSLKEAEEAMRASARTKQAAALQTSTPVPSGGGATATATVPPNVVQFPANPQQAAIAMRVPRPATAPPPAAAPPAATGQGGGLESQLQQNLQTIKTTGKLPAPDRTALLNPSNVEEKVVGWATEGGFSKAQIVKSLKEAGFNQERGMASELVDLIFKKHGITRR